MKRETANRPTKWPRARLYELLFVLLFTHQIALSQTPDLPVAPTLASYIDSNSGKKVDELVTLALTNNAELTAMRQEAQAGDALLRQARLRPNPSLEITGARQLGGTDNNVMAQGGLPLELGGRRTARIRIAERELEIRKLAALERERQVAAEVRSKFGEALAAILKLKFTEEMLSIAKENFDLVAAKVAEGRTQPLEQNMESVELNRIRVMRETAEGAVELRMFELRNLVGMNPEAPLKLRGDFTDLLARLVPPQEIATQVALLTRPDIVGARAVERLGEARIEQAKAEGRIDADVMLGYQRMRSGFPLLGIEESTGALLPIESKFHFFTFGVRLNLPVRNRNQGMIAAAQLEAAAARSRREFGELTVRREIASAYARYNRALRAMEIYRVGVRDQAAANLSVVRQTYELGSKTLLDYIAEQRRFIDTESGYIDAQLEAYLALVDILRATYAAELVNK
ncbi:MAG: TolC family protein [Blastocatellia bacterium]|nr:TolC family protein [Blastocatellia bacterium]